MRGFHVTPAQKIAFGYASIALFGALLLLMPFSHRVSIGPTDAVFTSASALFVTGLTTVTTATAWTVAGKCIIALLMQVGGWGITLVTTLVYLTLGRKIPIGERQFMAEDKNWGVGGIVKLIKRIFYFSMTIEGIAAAIFILYFHFHYDYPWIRAIGFGCFNSISAFNNAGFDLWGNSLEGFRADPLVLILTSLLIILGGLGFVVLSELYTYPRTRKLTLHTRVVLRVTGILLVLGVILTLLFEAKHSMAKLDWPLKILNAWFTSVSLRTAGFDSIPIGNMRDVTWFIMTGFMFVGASPGSTGGGIKTTTFYMLIKATMATIRGRAEMVTRERSIPWEIATKSMVIFIVAMALVMVATLINATFEPNIDFMRLIFEEVSAFGTVGLTTGITGIVGDPMKWVLIFSMYVGRIGILTFLISLSRRTKTQARYLQEKILIG